MLTPSLALPALGGDTGGPERFRRSADPQAPRTRGRVRKRVRENQDRHVVTLLIAVFGVLVMIVASVQMTGTLRSSEIETALSGTLTSVAQQQADFRTLHERFGRWDELQARGLRLPANQRLVKSNATASHWFVAIRDMETGMVCERTGELFDESPDERAASCRPLD